MRDWPKYDQKVGERLLGAFLGRHCKPCGSVGDATTSGLLEYKCGVLGEDVAHLFLT